MTETIQQLKEDIALLQMKLQKLEETQMTLEKSGEFSIVSYNGETYYRTLYDVVCGGWYKTDTNGEVFYLVEDETERKLEKLYHEQVVVKEPKKEQKWDVVRESVKWCEEHKNESVEEYLKPHTPEKTEQLLREAFQKVQQTEEWKETQRKIDSNYEEKVEEEPKPMNEVLDRLENKWNSATENAASYMTDDVVNRMLKKWEENPPYFLKFELGKTLEGLISDWMDDCVPAYSTWDYELGIAILIQRIEKWLPKEQSAAGSQNVDTELLVDGFNDCLKKIKSKLRNKK
jgi:hypothetical protein